jgi:hypothetical protein
MCGKPHNMNETNIADRWRLGGSGNLPTVELDGTIIYNDPVFLVPYTCFNLNLEFFAETRPNRQQYVCPFSVIENTIMKVRFNDDSCYVLQKKPLKFD